MKPQRTVSELLVVVVVVVNEYRQSQLMLEKLCYKKSVYSFKLLIGRRILMK